MPDENFNVVFQGQLVEGRSVEEVISGFCKRFSLKEEQVRGILGKRRFVLKRGVDEVKGANFIKVFAAIGMIVVLEPVSVSTDALKSAHANQPPTPAASIVPQASNNHQQQEQQQTAENSTAEANGEPGEINDIEFKFHGNGTEYFKIWIVNVLLSIVTLGIYSAWAKVRNKRYFYGNTELDGSSFEYLATPITILKGRLIASAVFIVYVVVGELVPVLGAILGIVFLFIMPWAILRSFAFNAINSAYRNVRFRFEGTYLQALAVFVGYPLLALITLGLLAPLAYYKQIQFFCNGHQYGTCKFKTDVAVKDVYIAFLIIVGASIGLAFAFVLVGLLIAPFAFLAGIIFYLSLFVFFAVKMTNLIYNALSLGKNGFTAYFELRSYAILFITNTLGIVLTLGLFMPWAKVRAARYKAQHIGYLAVTDMNGFVADQQENVKAMGEEFAEVFDWDFGF